MVVAHHNDIRLWFVLLRIEDTDYIRYAVNFVTSYEG